MDEYTKQNNNTLVGNAHMNSQIMSVKRTIAKQFKLLKNIIILINWREIIY